MACTLDRELAQSEDSLDLIGIDHPLVSQVMSRWRNASPHDVGAVVNMGLGQDAVLTMWLVQAYGKGSDAGTYVVPLAVDLEGKRVPTVERRFGECIQCASATSTIDPSERQRILHKHVDPALLRELGHRGIAARSTGYSAKMLAWVEVH